MRENFLFLMLLVFSLSCSLKGSKEQGTNVEKTTKPNIIIFYVDDLGYGDLSSYGAKGVQTPNVDKLVQEGLKFTDGHSPAATCTPSRYSLLTGEYAFRNNAAVLPGDAPLLIDTNKYTLPKMLQTAGYRTGVVGKWHLGLGLGGLDWNGKVAPGPLEIGFDYSFLLPSTGDRVPTVYLENYEVIGGNPLNPIQISYQDDLGQEKATDENTRYLSDAQHSTTLVNGVGRIGAMKGGEEAWWVDEDFPEVFTQKALSFIESEEDQPFFLFFSFHDIHVPRLPNDQFKNKSTMGPRGDAIVQMDWMTGVIMEKIRELKLSENTLVIFTSDNGPVLNDGYEDFAVEQLGDHQPSGIYRGGKYSAFEAGTRVPTITHWPGKITPGESSALFTQTDLLKSLAALTNVTVGPSHAIDSEDHMDALLGKDQNGREFLLEEALTLSIRSEEWKYIAPASEEQNFPDWVKGKGIESGFSREPQLYNILSDPEEQINVAKDHPEVVNDLEKVLEDIMKRKSS